MGAHCRLDSLPLHRIRPSHQHLWLLLRHIERHRCSVHRLIVRALAAAFGRARQRLRHLIHSEHLLGGLLLQIGVDVHGSNLSRACSPTMARPRGRDSPNKAHRRSASLSFVDMGPQQRDRASVVLILRVWPGEHVLGELCWVPQILTRHGSGQIQIRALIDELGLCLRDDQGLR